MLYKQIDNLAKGSHVGPTFANAFLVYDKKKRIEIWPFACRIFYYRRYVDDIFALVNSLDY